jgi:hypothetical protein
MSPRYTVIWKRSIIELTLVDVVARAMAGGEGVSAITVAMNEIERRLAVAPQTQGESRENYERVLIIPPLTVAFEVHEDERVAFVLRLHYAPRRHSEG